MFKLYYNVHYGSNILDHTTRRRTAELITALMKCDALHDNWSEGRGEDYTDHRNMNTLGMYNPTPLSADTPVRVPHFDMDKLSTRYHVNKRRLDDFYENHLSTVTKARYPRNNVPLCAAGLAIALSAGQRIPTTVTLSALLLVTGDYHVTLSETICTHITEDGVDKYDIQELVLRPDLRKAQLLGMGQMRNLVLPVITN